MSWAIRWPIGRAGPGWPGERGAAGGPAGHGLSAPAADGFLPERCRVCFVSENDATTIEFDFTGLPVSPALQVALALAFDAHTGPGGTVKAAGTARNVMGILRWFCQVVTACDPPPQAPAELRPALLDRFALSRRNHAGVAVELGALKAVLGHVDGDLLERWRAGDDGILADEHQAGDCHALDLADHGAVFRNRQGGTALPRWAHKHGTRQELMPHCTLHSTNSPRERSCWRT